MRKLLFILCTLSFMSCSTTIKSPVTQFEYTGYVEERGVGVTVKPPFWGWTVELYHYYFD